MTRLSSFRKKIRSGYVLSFLLLLFSYFLIFYVQQRLVREAGWVIHSYTIISNTEELKAELIDAETSVRGYIITKDARFLKPYDKALVNIPVVFKELKGLVADNKLQRSRLDTLDRLIRQKLEIMKAALISFRENGLAITGDVRTRRELNLRTMDSLRLYVSTITGAEQQLMQTRKTRLSDLFNGANIISVVSLIIVFLALLFSLVTFNRANKAREIADDRANQYMIDLENNQNELREKNVELKELKEVEKFTSTGRIARTIAHEVRNPLTNILLATEQLREMENSNEESPVLLELINRNAARINQLVSGLLDATRFTHLDFTTASVNELLEEALEMAKDRIELSQVRVEKIMQQIFAKYR
ncbi:MAG: CHASE3 domain-containing protein [Bacteroidota bacterium]